MRLLDGVGIAAGSDPDFTVAPIARDGPVVVSFDWPLGGTAFGQATFTRIQ